ncbi:hypothetical protein ACIBAC_42395 [Streptomyces sp. NPDC051362]|uniref:MmyB family transcriptional regulator n=1 Tax=Streptomyces sp. NPDC051362 TaxID=3365651 RepID=UPI0037BC8A52
MSLDHSGNEQERLSVLATREVAEPNRVVRPAIKLMLEKLRPCPAYVLSRTLDVLAANPGGLYLYPGVESWPVQQRNLVRYAFLDPAAKELLPDWEACARRCVARLWALAGTDPEAPDLLQLVGELQIKSDDFARLWQRYYARPPHGRGITHFRHSQVGDIALEYQSMQLEGTPGHRLVAHNGAAASDHDAMVLLDMLGARNASGRPGMS